MSYLRIFAVTIIVFLVDRITKIWVVDWLDLRNVFAIDVWPPFFNLRMAWNEGVNFGLFSSDGDTGRYVLIAVALLIVLGLLFYVRKDKGWKVPVSTGLIVGGALGNVYDRIIFGAVADFINMSCCGINNPYAFNVADATIFIGVIGLLFFMDDKKKT